MALRMMGKKKGMIKRFDQSGNLVVCTVIVVEPNVITQIKRKETDGYNALQIGYEKIETTDPRTVQKRVTKQLLGHFQKGNLSPMRYLKESKLDGVENFSVGQKLDLSLFEDVSHVDVAGVSKGKGFAGVMKRHNFSGGPAAHGSGFHRHAGSTGMRSTPGRCLPGVKKAGRLGGENVTVQNLRVESIDAENHILIVRGAVPGAKEALVSLAPAPKKKQKIKQKAG